MMNPGISTLYEKFEKEVREAESKDAQHLGFLSRMVTGKSGEADALLPYFDAGVQAETEKMADRLPDSAEVRELAEWMLGQSEAQRSVPSLRYSFMAVQRHLIPLIRFLNGEDSRFLTEKFEAAFPRRERFPSHVQLIKALKKQSQH